MSPSQHDGASDEGEKRNGNGSQDRWHQRPGSGARGRRGSGSLRHDCAAHCSHHHNGDQGGAPHCCQSRSHCADDDEVHKKTGKGSDALLCFSYLQTCLFHTTCSAGELALLDRFVTVARRIREERSRTCEQAAEWRRCTKGRIRAVRDSAGTPHPLCTLRAALKRFPPLPAPTLRDSESSLSPPALRVN